MNDDTISRKAAVNALWKALYAYEDKTEKQFQESEDLDIYDWMVHRVFVQNMSDIDRRIILDLPSAERRGQWILKYGNGHIEKSIVGGECSLCGFVGPATRYCPNCGAKMDDNLEEPAINPCRGCEDYDGKGGCISKGGCGAKMEVEE